MDYKKKYLKYKLKYLTAKKLFGGSRSKKEKSKSKKKEIDPKVKVIKKKPEITKLEISPEDGIKKMEKNFERLNYAKEEMRRRTDAAAELSEVPSPGRSRSNAFSSTPPGTPKSENVRDPPKDHEKRRKRVYGKDNI